MREKAKTKEERARKEMGRKTIFLSQGMHEQGGAVATHSPRTVLRPSASAAISWHCTATKTRERRTGRKALKTVNSAGCSSETRWRHFITFSTHGDKSRQHPSRWVLRGHPWRSSSSRR